MPTWRPFGVLGLQGLAGGAPSKALPWTSRVSQDMWTAIHTGYLRRAHLSVCTLSAVCLTALGTLTAPFWLTEFPALTREKKKDFILNLVCNVNGVAYLTSRPTSPPGRFRASYALYSDLVGSFAAVSAALASCP